MELDCQLVRRARELAGGGRGKGSVEGQIKLFCLEFLSQRGLAGNCQRLKFQGCFATKVLETKARTKHSPRESRRAEQKERDAKQTFDL
jgi:hypothetical protein